MMNQQSQFGLRSPWRAVAAMFILNGLLYGIWASRIPAIASQHQLDKASLGLLLLALATGAILSFPLAGRWTDQYGSAPITKKIAVAYAAALVGLALAPNVWLLACALFLFGATHGSMDVAMNAWAGEVERHMARPVMSSFHAMWSVGAGVGAASGYAAANLQASPQDHFIVMATLSLAITLPWAMISWQSTRHEKQDGAKGPLFPLPKGALVLVGIVAFCASLGEGAMADWSAIFLVSVAQADEATAALGFSVFSVAMVIMRLAADQLVQKIGPAQAARIGGLLAGLGVSLAIFISQQEVILIGFALMGLGYAVLFPLAFSRAANDGSLSPGAAIASVATLGYGGLLLGPVIIGFVAEISSLQIAFLILAALAMVIILLAHVLALPPQTKKAVPGSAKQKA